MNRSRLHELRLLGYLLLLSAVTAVWGQEMPVLEIRQPEMPSLPESRPMQPQQSREQPLQQPMRNDCLQLPAPMPGTPVETLENAWQCALAHDYSLKAAREKIRAADFQSDAARHARIPSIGNKTSYTFLSNNLALNAPPDLKALGLSGFDMTEDKIALTTTQASVPIYTGGKISSSIDMADANRDSVQCEYQTQRLDLLLEVVKAYISILRAQQAVNVAASEVRSLESHQRDVENLKKQGIVALNDLLAVQVKVAEAQQDELKARNQLDIAMAAYNRLLGMPMDRPIRLEEIKSSDRQYDLNQLTQAALTRRPELGQIASNGRALQSEAQKETSAVLPQAQFMTGITYFSDEHVTPNQLWNATFSLAWTPYDGGVASRKSASLMHQNYAVSKMKADAETKIALEVRSIWLTLCENRHRIEVASRAIEHAEENLRISRDRYNKGVGTNTEVLDAETMRAASVNNYYTAIYDAAYSEFRLRRAVGEL